MGKADIRRDAAVPKQQKAHRAISTLHLPQVTGEDRAPGTDAGTGTHATGLVSLVNSWKADVHRAFEHPYHHACKPYPCRLAICPQDCVSACVHSSTRVAIACLRYANVLVVCDVKPLDCTSIV